MVKGLTDFRGAVVSAFAGVVLATAAGAAQAQPSRGYGVDDVRVAGAQPRVFKRTADSQCCSFCGRQTLEAIVPTQDGPRRFESDGRFPLRRKFCGTVTRYGVNDENADPRDIMMNIRPLPDAPADTYGPFVAGFYKTESTPLEGDPLASAFDHNDCDVQQCLDAARTRENKQVHAEITPPNEFFGVDRRFLPIDSQGECGTGWGCSSWLENAGTEVCVYGVYAFDHGGHWSGDHANLCCVPDPGHDHPEIHPFDAIWWRHPEQDGWVFAVFQDDSNRYSFPYCGPPVAGTPLNGGPSPDDGRGWSQAPRDVTLSFPFSFDLKDAPLRATVRRFSAVVPLDVTTAGRTKASDEVKTLRVKGRVALVVEEEPGAETETWIKVVGGRPGNAPPARPRPADSSPSSTVSGYVIVRVAVGCGKTPGSTMNCLPAQVRAMAPSARVAEDDIGSGFYYGQIVFDRPERCRREETAVASARGALQEARADLRSLEAELVHETSPAVRKNIEKLIKKLRTGTIPEAERALQASEAALAACTAG